MANSDEMIWVSTTHTAQHHTGLWQAVQPLFVTPQPGQVVELTLVDGDRSVHLHVDTQAAVHGNQQQQQQQQQQQGVAAEPLRDIYVDMAFVPSPEVKGLDFGKQIMLHKYPLHLKKHEAHGLLTYSQSDRCRYVQGGYHFLTGGLGSSVSKCVIFLLNTVEDVTHLAAKWPSDVQMGDLEEKVLHRSMSYVFCREKISKGAITFYLYYVKKEGSETVRLDNWLHLVCAVGTKANVTDWASVIYAAMGEAASLALGFC